MRLAHPWTILTAAAGLVATASGQGAYTPYDLGYGYAYAINSAGLIVGTAGADWPRRAFSRTGHATRDLGTLGGDWSIAYSVNDAGIAVGTSLTTAGIQHAFRHEDGTMTDLDGPGSASSSAYAINNAGTIIGVRNDRAFSLRSGVYTDLGTLGGLYSAPLGINDAGMIVGQSDTAGGPEHAFVHLDGVMTDLGTFGGVASEARDINNRGDIVGSVRMPSGEERIFIATATGEVVQMPEGLGGPWSWPMAINDAGTVVGNSYVDNVLFHAFVYHDGEMTDLAPVLAEIGITGFSQALGINEWGDIVGWGEDAEGKPHAFLLAIPEPSAHLVLWVGVVTLTLRFRLFLPSWAVRRSQS